MSAIITTVSVGLILIGTYYLLSGILGESKGKVEY